MTWLHGRHVGPLVTVWSIALLIAAGLRWLQVEMPALVDMVTPLYLVLLGIMVVVTVKWFRARGEQRRHADRRHADRRTHPSTEA